MNRRVLLADFSRVYTDEGFVDFLEREALPFERVDLTEIEGTACYCDEAAAAEIALRLQAAFPEKWPKLRWLDSGDYHYLSYLLSLHEKEPFHLVLLDNHPDNQEPAFGGILSCGSWVKVLREEHPLVRDILTIGPEGCPDTIPDGWLEARRGERVCVSLDKDVMDRPWARTNWNQGSFTLDGVKAILQRIFESGMELVAVDVCGALTSGQGATAEDFAVNLKTDIELQLFINNYLN
jgi:hypothetical protein